MRHIKVAATQSVTLLTLILIKKANVSVMFFLPLPMDWLTKKIATDFG